MKKFILGLLLASSFAFAQYPVTANRITTGAGAPSAGCSAVADRGKVYIRKDAAAASSSLYACVNTTGTTTAWELQSGGGGGGVPPAGSIVGQVQLFASSTTLGASTNFIFSQGSGGNLVLIGSNTANLFPQIDGTAGAAQLDQTFRNTGTNLNVATFQGMSTDSFSAVRFASSTGLENMAVGHANSTAALLPGANFIESSTPTGTVPITYFMTSVLDTNTHTLRGMMAHNSNGGIMFAGCDLLSASACAIAAVPTVQAPLDVFGPSIFSTPPVSNGSRGSVFSGGFPLNAIQTSGAAGVLRLVRDLQAKMDVLINTTPLRVDFRDTDHSNAIPLSFLLDGSGTISIGGTTFNFNGKSCAIVSTVLTCT